jgi:hypothetical protein
MESPALYNVKLINEVEPPELQDIEVPKVLGDVFEALIGKSQGCGSGLIQYGSGSGSKLKQNFRRKFFSQIFLKSKFESNQKYRCYN